jgi:hypothetical protein
MPELRRRLCAEADPAGEGMAAGINSCEAAAPSDKRVHLSYSVDDMAAHSGRIRNIPPEER